MCTVADLVWGRWVGLFIMGRTVNNKNSSSSLSVKLDKLDHLSRYMDCFLLLLFFKV